MAAAPENIWTSKQLSFFGHRLKERVENWPISDSSLSSIDSFAIFRQFFSIVSVSAAQLLSI
ncbi:hypothetical protein L484_017212 [Morus notabilis]|uniref:Uncharacterized protein n=1 Tax=Morus notabilis TaxID=981085 RepID=W9R3J1_9ROSA|nr:hypothetical protein L484_017212 [Morus notabilis]